MTPLRLSVFLFLSVLACQGPAASDAPLPDPSSDPFAGAQWIAMEPDSTLLFPHVHLLAEDSPQGRSLKEYTLPELSRDFHLRGKVRSARLNICGLGQYTLTLNGEPVGDYFLSPGWTLYNKRLMYNEFDVTQLLRKARRGEVSVRVRLGGGMYDIPVRGYHKMAGSAGAPKLIFRLHVDYADGTAQDLVSDPSWTASPSPVRYASIYAGEWFDATVEPAPRPAVSTHPHWDVPLVRQRPGTFIRIRQELPSKRIAPELYDLGQNSSGILRIRVKGRRGQRITLRPSEVLRDGAIYQRSLPGYTWTYTLRGDRRGETWQPAFSYTGFRYVQVEADEGVEVLELTGLHTTTDAPQTGSFACSDTLLNHIHSLIDWAIRSNLVSITTDCPTREKLGWQEQNHLMAHSMMYRYDMRELMNKIADDLADSQHPDGAIPTTAPEYTPFEPGSGFEDTPEWGASFILCPWYTYLWYGDDSALRRHFGAMDRYIAYLATRAEGGILDYGLGDWFDIGPRKPGKAQLTSVALSATATYHYLLTTMEQIARHLGHDADAARYAGMAAQVRAAFNRRFRTGGRTVYEHGSQTALAMALYMGLVPEELRARTVEALVRDIELRGYALTAGDIGYRYVVQALQQNGRSDVIFKMNHNDAIPGYAYQLKQGATALTESWQAYDDVSNNHLMLGHLMEWLYGGLGGIRPDAPQHFVFDPQMAGDVTWARTSLQTPGGQARCDWTKSPDGTRWTVEITVPDGCEAEIRLPDGRVLDVPAGAYSYSSTEKK
ncbi:MAG: family 78 glycoside hydrolase catalytic domain [Bacteroidales bacterium]|nr:family 78 glycoside hydrolase catalytic domain [Bacteroidales bacterium]